MRPKDSADGVLHKADGAMGSGAVVPERPPWKVAQDAKELLDRQPVTKAQHDQHTGVLARLLRKTTHL
jgi:hypothetical protein